MDSDSSVDRVDLDGKVYRLKCDICKSKRTGSTNDNLLSCFQPKKSTILIQ